MAIHFEIHPSIGIARVGTSAQFFVGNDPGAATPTSYRDTTPAKALLKQAARFRVFRCERDAAGRLIGPPVPITTADGAIRWTVEVANRKAAAERLVKGGTPRRNSASGKDATDATLLIRPSARTIDQANPVQSFDDGTFRGLAVPLGSAQLQADGSLIFLSATGQSGSRTAAGGAVATQTFADNDDWWDDTCEGPVRAEIRLADNTLHQAIAARIVVGPPDFAPEIEPFVTLHDIAYQAAITRQFLTADVKPSFSRHILPFLRRAFMYAWVNQHSGEGHGTGHGGNFLPRLAQLGDPGAPKVMRERIFSRLRPPTETTPSPSTRMPRLFSEEGYAASKKVIALPPVFFHYFRQWVDGDFVKDFGPDPFAQESIVDKLDRTAQQSCVGAGFFPGIEVPRFVSAPGVWVAAFRLDPTIPAGRVTEGLGVPWQSDFTQCQWESDKDDPSDREGFGWWPSQRPDHVYSSVAKAQAQGPRDDWDRGATDVTSLIVNYSNLGIVVRRPVAGGDVFVETERLLKP